MKSIIPLGEGNRKKTQHLLRAQPTIVVPAYKSFRYVSLFSGVMSAAGQLHAVMFWIVHSYCIKRLNAGELCKMNMFNQIDAADMDFFFPVGTVCLFNNWDNCAVMMVLDCSLLLLPGSNSNTCKQ